MCGEWQVYSTCLVKTFINISIEISVVNTNSHYQCFVVREASFSDGHCSTSCRFRRFFISAAIIVLVLEICLRWPMTSFGGSRRVCGALQLTSQSSKLRAVKIIISTCRLVSSFAYQQLLPVVEKRCFPRLLYNFRDRKPTLYVLVHDQLVIHSGSVTKQKPRYAQRALKV